MANGKDIQKLKDELNDRGCEQGRIRELRFIQYDKDVNGIGKRLTLLMRIMIIIGLMLLADLGPKAIPILVKLFGG